MKIKIFLWMFISLFIMANQCLAAKYDIAGIELGEKIDDAEIIMKKDFPDYYILKNNNSFQKGSFTTQKILCGLTARSKDGSSLTFVVDASDQSTIIAMNRTIKFDVASRPSIDDVLKNLEQKYGKWDLEDSSSGSVRLCWTSELPQGLVDQKNFVSFAMTQFGFVNSYSNGDYTFRPALRFGKFLSVEIFTVGSAAGLLNVQIIDYRGLTKSRNYIVSLLDSGGKLPLPDATVTKPLDTKL